MSTDRIEKKIVLRAPHSRVWRAIADSTEFGKWFGVELDGPFVEGVPIHGVIAPSKVNAEVAEAQSEHAGAAFEFTVERIEPERLFSFRWHPFAIDRDYDYSQEPTTLVVFELQDVPDGVLLTIVESGFDKVPLARRADAFSANDEGWSMMVKAVEQYVEQVA